MTAMPSGACWEVWSAIHAPSRRDVTEDGTVRVWSMGQTDAPLGASWTPSTSEWRNDGGGSSCSLTEVLHDGPVPTRYFLSSKACVGILRRAEKRGKALPEALHLALARIASTEMVKGPEELQAKEAASV